uniref:Uncharacterized protein n=1 Tax=Arundo donax TaxID=35708 RepID=A0A0A9FTT9_ARUDO
MWFCGLSEVRFLCTVLCKSHLSYIDVEVLVAGRDYCVTSILRSTLKSVEMLWY